jgi:anti-sigma regulatory factor (Ser/Thr protein kinase)
MSAAPQPHERSFVHEAMFYSGQEGFLEGAMNFIEQGVRASEQVLVVVGAAKIGLLREALGSEADEVDFADMSDVGSNPNRIIAAWQDFVERRGRPGRRIRGIGEPIYPSRAPAELAECQRHERLLNVAFEDAGAFWLLCPYDTAALAPEVVEEARRSHPVLSDGHARFDSRQWVGIEQAQAPSVSPLPEPPTAPSEVHFDGGSLASVRLVAASRARGAGFGADQTNELVLCVNEVASNSLRHAGGTGVLRAWTDRDCVVCEVRDRGRFDQPLAGRFRPAPDDEAGRGLWLANQLCDLVQIRSLPDGTAVRLHMRRR